MRAVFLVAFLISSLFCRGQQDDGKEIATTMERLFGILSFSDTVSMQIDSLPSLFTSDGRLVAAFGKKPIVFSPKQYVESIRSSTRSGQVYRSGERELARKADVFGRIAHVLSTYELTITGKDGTVVRRGLNSIQMIRQDGRWLITSLLWDRESSELKLPLKYLPAGQ